MSIGVLKSFDLAQNPFHFQIKQTQQHICCKVLGLKTEASDNPHLLQIVSQNPQTSNGCKRDSKQAFSRSSQEPLTSITLSLNGPTNLVATRAISLSSFTVCMNSVLATRVLQGSLGCNCFSVCCQLDGHWLASWLMVPGSGGHGPLAMTCDCQHA